jgi:hypothetical protein
VKGDWVPPSLEVEPAGAVPWATGRPGRPGVSRGDSAGSPIWIEVGAGLPGGAGETETVTGAIPEVMGSPTGGAAASSASSAAREAR